MSPASPEVVAAVALAACRVAGIAAFAPVVAAPAVPVRVRAGLALVLAVAAIPALSAGSLPAIAVAEPWRLVPAAALEFALGSVIGVLAMLPVAAFRTAGALAGMQAGVGFGQMLEGSADPGDADGDPFGQLLALLGAACFVWAGGLEALALAALQSFDGVALGAWAAGGAVLPAVLGAAVAASELAFRVALPVTAVLVAEAMVSGMVARSVPGMGLLSFGFPLRFAVASLALLAGVAAMQSAMNGALAGAIAAIRTLVAGDGA